MQHENLTIRIFKASDDEGYFFDIYLLAPEDITEDSVSEDGGLCTSEDIRNAVDMASEQAKALVVAYDNKNHSHA